MTRLLALALLLALVPPAQAQAQTAPVRVTWIQAGNEAMGRPYLKIMRGSLARLGQVEGRSYVLDALYVEGRFERYPALIAEAVRRGAAVLVVAGYQGTAAAMGVTSKVPIVGMGCGVEVLVASLARPGGNVTGVTCQSGDLSLKQLQILREALPNARRVALLHNAAARYMAPTVRNLQAAAEPGTMIDVPVASIAEFATAVQRIREAHADAVFIVPDLFLFANRQALMKALLEGRLPTMSTFAEFAQAGALVSYGADTGALVEQGAWYVDRIAKGASPAELPMEQPTKFELVVNLAAARTFGLAVPASLVARADRVIPAQ